MLEFQFNEFFLRSPGFRPNAQSKNPVSPLRKLKIFTQTFKSRLKSADEDSIVSKIDEENDELCSMSEKKRPSRISNPIHIGHHTVSGHEAMNLAKRLSEELATQNQTGSDSVALNLPRAMSPECEPISRSFEGKKGDLKIVFYVAQVYVSVSIVLGNGMSSFTRDWSGPHEIRTLGTKICFPDFVSLPVLNYPKCFLHAMCFTRQYFLTFRFRD